MFAIVDPNSGNVLEVRETSFAGLPSPLTWVAVPTELVGLQPNQLAYEGETLVERPPVSAPTNWPILKSTIRQRLRQQDLEETADTVRAGLPAADQVEWVECLYVERQDTRMIAFLTAIGADVETTLARDPAASRIFGALV